MLRLLLSPAALRQAADAIRRGPYVEGAATPRPWLGLLAFVALSGALVIGLTLAAGAFVGMANGAGVQLINPDMLEGRAGRFSPTDEIGFVLALAVILMLMAICLLAAAVIVYRQPGRAFVWPDQTGRWRQLGIGFIALLAILFVQWPLFAWLEGGGIAPILDPGEPLRLRLFYAVAVAGGLFFAAAAEEIAFRGILLRILGGLTRKVWLILLINGTLFSLIHLDPDPVAFVARALSGMIWAWAALRLGSIAFGVGAHWANNLFIAWFIEPMSAAATPGEAIPPPYLAAELFTIVGVLIVVELLARGRPAPR